MTDADVINLVTAGLQLALKLAGPTLLACLLVGVVTSVLQAVFQINDQAVAFVPKLAAVGVVLVITGPWMLQATIDFFTTLMKTIPSLTG